MIGFPINFLSILVSNKPVHADDGDVFKSWQAFSQNVNRQNGNAHLEFLARTFPDPLEKAVVHVLLAEVFSESHGFMGELRFLKLDDNQFFRSVGFPHLCGEIQSVNREIERRKKLHNGRVQRIVL